MDKMSKFLIAVIGIAIIVIAGVHIPEELAVGIMVGLATHILLYHLYKKKHIPIEYVYVICIHLENDNAALNDRVSSAELAFVNENDAIHKVSQLNSYWSNSPAKYTYKKVSLIEYSNCK